MHILWKQSEKDSRIYEARVGRLYARVTKMEDGSLPYNVSISDRKGVKRAIHIVENNPTSENQILAFRRCNFILKCYDLDLGVDLLPEERPEYPGSIYQPVHIPKPRKAVNTVAGVDINGVYKHHSGQFYVVTSIANALTEDKVNWPTTVVYRNISTGDVYARTITTWERSGYILHKRGSRIDLGKGFYGIPTDRKEN